MKKIFVPKRINEIVNRLTKTKEEKKHDFRRDKEQFIEAEEKRKKAAKKQMALDEKQKAAERKEQLDLLHYKDVMKVQNMTSNRELVEEGKTVEGNYSFESCYFCYFCYFLKSSNVVYVLLLFIIEIRDCYRN